MKTPSVQDWMTPNPIVVCPHTTLPEAKRLMQKHHIRRLPVVESGQLVGIVTLSDVRKAGASSVDSLSVFDLNFLLAELTIDRIMTRQPLTVQVSDKVSVAASLMLERKIGALPVMRGEQLVGIITETDILRGLVQWEAGLPSSRAAETSLSQTTSGASLITR